MNQNDLRSKFGDSKNNNWFYPVPEVYKNTEQIVGLLQTRNGQFKVVAIDPDQHKSNKQGGAYIVDKKYTVLSDRDPDNLVCEYQSELSVHMREE